MSSLSAIQQLFVALTKGEIFLDDRTFMTACIMSVVVYFGFYSDE